MSEVESKKAGKGQSPRNRLKYIVARLKELNDEKKRLTEERSSIRSAIAAEKGEGGGRAKRQAGKSGETDDTVDG